jgi:hypothetical protein
MFRAYLSDRSLMPRLLEVEGLPEEVYDAARRVAVRRSTDRTA